MAKEHKVKILMTEFVTHDVKRFILQKPVGYKFLPGQATEISIANHPLENEKRPFTFTSLNPDAVLEFTIKKYPEHKGVTQALHKLKSQDSLIIRDVWGTINYKGPGVFISAGAGITPFIAILRDLNSKGKLKGSSLIFSNKTQDDIILEKELKAMPLDSLILILTRQSHSDYYHGRINSAFLKKHIKNFKQHFYVCGPVSFVGETQDALKKLGASSDSIVFEK